MILRPGRLVGGPFTNTDIAALLKTNEGSRKSIKIEPGDGLVGDAARLSVAELVARVSTSWWKEPQVKPLDWAFCLLRYIRLNCSFMSGPWIAFLNQALRGKEADNKELCIINTEGDEFTDADWKSLLASL